MTIAPETLKEIIKTAIKLIIDSKDFKIILIDSAGNVISDIKLSDLRDALKGSNNKDFSTLEADVESILAQIDIKLSEHRDALKGTDNKDFSTLEADVEGIKAQTDKLRFDDLLALLTNRLDSLASLRKSLTIPEGSLYQVPEGQKVIVKDYVLAEGDLYVEGDLLAV